MMTQTRCNGGRAVVAWWLLAMSLAWFSAACPAADLVLAVLKSGTEVYTNVTVYGQTETDLFIRHARGFGNVKISSLDPESLRLLKLEDPAAPKSGAAEKVAGLKTKLASSTSWMTLSKSKGLASLSQVRPSQNLLLGVAVGLGVGYLLFCVCIKLICVNAGSEAGMLIWFPVLQMFPLLRAARMSGWWLVVLLIPLVGMLAHIVWSVNIAKVCGKGPMTMLLLILPVTSLLAFIYLAFSSSGGSPVQEKAKAMPRHIGTSVLGGA